MMCNPALIDNPYILHITAYKISYIMKRWSRSTVLPRPLVCCKAHCKKKQRLLSSCRPGCFRTFFSMRSPCLDCQDPFKKDIADIAPTHPAPNGKTKMWKINHWIMSKDVRKSMDFHSWLWGRRATCKSCAYSWSGTALWTSQKLGSIKDGSGLLRVCEMIDEEYIYIVYSSCSDGNIGNSYE